MQIIKSQYIYRLSFFFKETLQIKKIKVKKDRNKRLKEMIGTYPLEILVESIKAVKSLYNYSFIDANKKHFCFKTSTVNIAGR